MSEYIERDAVKDMLKRECSPRVMAYLVDELCEIPAADVRPAVVCANCEHNNACLTQAFVEEVSRVPFDRNAFFCADGEKRKES